jgi:Xaa-Pro aminopeptidase
MRVRGHGVGITSDAPGNMTIDNEAVFREGMMFCLQPNQYLPETGYMMAGDTVVVGKKGAKSLCSSEPVLGVVPA